MYCYPYKAIIHYISSCFNEDNACKKCVKLAELAPTQIDKIIFNVFELFSPIHAKERQYIMK